MRDKTVADAMTPLESVFMLDIQSVIDRKTINEVHKSNIHNVQLPTCSISVSYTYHQLAYYCW